MKKSWVKRIIGTGLAALLFIGFHFYEKPAMPESMDDLQSVGLEEVAGLTACILTNMCMQPSNTETLKGVKYSFVEITDEKIPIRYYHPDENSGLSKIRILFTENDYNQVLIEDSDLDGYVDIITEITAGKISVHRLNKAKPDPSFISAQVLYLHAMNLAEAFIIPPVLKSYMERDRKKGLIGT